MAPFAALMVAPSNGLFGPILLLGVLLAVIGGAGEIRIYAGLGLGGLILWGLIHPAMGVPLLRFNSASLVLLLTCTGAMLACDRLRELKGIHVAGVLAVGSLIIAFAALQGLVPAWQSLISSRARVSFWRANVPSWRAMEFANGHIDPAQHKVLLIGETRGLWLNIPYIAPSPFNGPQLAEMFASPDPEEWSDKLRRLGITHLLINTPEWERLRERRAYFLLPDKNIDSFNRWLHSLPIVFNDDQGTVVLPLQAKAR
jgi:hypothetical protein